MVDHSDTGELFIADYYDIGYNTFVLTPLISIPAG